VAANKQHVEKIINYVEENGIPRKRVYIMPLTSEGMTIEEILKLHREIAEEALQNRVNFSPRLHLLLGLK
jgi:7-carboxy-7-deazaguanine synthase